MLKYTNTSKHLQQIFILEFNLDRYKLKRFLSLTYML